MRRQGRTHPSFKNSNYENKKNAERTRFELVIPFRGIHAFQACLFNHSSTSPTDFGAQR